MTLIPTLTLLLVAGTAHAASEVRVLESDPPQSDDIVVVENANQPAVYEWVSDDGAQGEARAVFTQPVNKGVYQIRSSDNDESIEIRIEDGEVVKLMRNGEKVPENRFSFEGGVVTIFDADGNVLHTHDIHPPKVPSPPPLPGERSFGPKVIQLDNGNFSYSVQPELRFGPGDLAFGTFEQPKVMLGIHQGVPGAALRHHLGLNEDQKCILIEEVIPGLPAERAGMKRFDILLQADGDAVDATVLRGLLAEKDPGDDVTFRVIRKGDKKELTVELEAYDAEKLGMATPTGSFFSSTPGQNIFVVPQPPTAPNAQPAPQGWIQRLDVPDFEGELRFDVESFSDPEKAQEAIDKLRAQIEKHRENMQFDGNRLFITEDLPKIRARVQGLTDEAEEGAEVVLRRAEEAAEQAERLAGRVAPMASDRLDRIESRLDTLEGSLTERLEKLFDRLDSISERLKDGGGESDEGEI